MRRRRRVGLTVKGQHEGDLCGDEYFTVVIALMVIKTYIGVNFVMEL